MTGRSRRSRDNKTRFLDDFVIPVLSDEKEKIPMSDEEYALQLQLQEALISSSVSSSRGSIKGPSKQPIHPRKKRKGTVESSQSFCTICLDVKLHGEMFVSHSCTHTFCTDCISQYVATKIQENISMVKCPDLNCKGILEPQNCREIVPAEVFDRWENTLCESLVLGSQKFYCPFGDCSALLVDDGGVTVTSSECPNCRRLFCAQCKVAWHAGMTCSEFEKFKGGESKKEDKMVMKLVKKKKWKRCPNCSFYVDKISGCIHISCRCGFEFCYRCGSKWSDDHAC
ncbi:E3 ubiquitin-protein ligase [Tripterygium wilfordii]|uniref:RBR-type E3 ubiquitin transferase n=1 Tax=Tripterygium wilfordii TaxID=458696 RepID=A0A7J7CDY2_TRIWF|nr:E3 ubiquitin-protein ligase RNF144A-like [Tripterygium wilfordii]XP_038684378.1 E3 ubiquitin-protein ligase RNF144A-like [Tripterygium wilfordii]KAF5732087.1 E3 ubiquitin-protein ligase [Tripterygium wilfordii]